MSRRTRDAYWFRVGLMLLVLAAVVAACAFGAAVRAGSVAG